MGDLDHLSDSVHYGERDFWGVDTTLFEPPAAGHLPCCVARWPVPHHGHHTRDLYHCGELGQRRREGGEES